MKLVVDRVPEDAPPVPEGEDPFAAFTSETAAPAVPEKATRRTWRSLVDWPRFGRLGRRAMIAALSLVVLVALGIAGAQQIRTRWFAALTPGRFTVTSTPSGAEVWIDEARRGVTPLTVELATGPHKVRLRAAGMTRELSVASKPNLEIVQAVELAPPATTTGSLSVTSDPPGMRLTIDGTARGTTPALVDQLTPGAHTVTLAGSNGSASRSVVIQAGSTATLMISKPTDNAEGVGSVTVTSPIDVQLFEGETLVGSSRSARLFLPAGAHTITAVNETLGFRNAIRLDVRSGATSKVAVQIPNGALSVNAQPWAEVFVDGKSLGETPIGNYALPIGSHELVLKHPQLGERRQNVVIGVGRTARVGVDLRK